MIHSCISETCHRKSACNMHRRTTCFNEAVMFMSPFPNGDNCVHFQRIIPDVERRGHMGGATAVSVSGNE